ncbi:MAG: hypothetical protein FIB02_06060 [Desulfuromonas sp.]|nr:hypothetical protein [Desulfuromonas sp.]
MFRVIFCPVLLVLVIISCGLSWADTFKCTRSDGSVFLTNDPAQVPKGCAIERVKDLPPVGVLPQAPAPPHSVPVQERAVPQQMRGEEARSFESYVGEAVQLVEKFHATRRDMVTSSFVADELKARHDLADIRGQANDLRKEISRAELSGSEKRKLDELLAPITE